MASCEATECAAEFDRMAERVNRGWRTQSGHLFRVRHDVVIGGASVLGRADRIVVQAIGGRSFQ